MITASTNVASAAGDLVLCIAVKIKYLPKTIFAKLGKVGLGKKREFKLFIFIKTNGKLKF